MSQASLKERIDKIPGDEGWWKGGEEVFLRLALELASGGLGLGEEKIIALLTDAYWAVASEYGA